VAHVGGSLIRQAGYTMTCDTCGAVVADPDTTAWHLLRECAAAGWERFAEKDICPACRGLENPKMSWSLDQDKKAWEALYTSDQNFYYLLAQVAAIFTAKNHDYTSHGLFGPGSNLLRCEEFDVPAWKGVLIRLGDKWSRLTTFAKKGLLAVKDESVEDTFLDMAIYSLLGVLAYRRAREADRKPEPLTATRTGTGPNSLAAQVQCFPEGWPLKEVPSSLAIQPPVPTPTERR
jgi:hypothetical protein